MGHPITLDPHIAKSIDYIHKNDARLEGIFQVHQQNKVLDESTQYFWDNLDRIAKKDYVPTKQDIINIRFRSTGIVEMTFTNKELRFHIFDLGGQRSERKKWIQCFDNVTAIVFVISSSCYNELMYEDSEQTKMEDAMRLFEKTIGNKIFEQTPIILLLNKTDLFAKKIKGLPVTIDPTFDDFDGRDAYDFEETTAFIQRKFEAVNCSHNRMMYTHLTCALDEANVRDVFDDIMHVIVKNNLKNGGLI